MKFVRAQSCIARVFLLISFLSWEASGNSWTPHSSNKPSFRVGIAGGSLGFNFRGSDSSPAKPLIQYRPNSQGRLAVGAQYLGLGATVGITGKQSPEEEYKRGHTDGVDYQFRFFREQNSFDIFYQRYHGYFIENSRAVDSSVSSSDPFLQRPDLQTEHMGLQYFRTLSPESFSLAAGFDQSGWQTQSGGTWFLYGAVDQHRISADSSLIPPSVSSQYAEITDFQGGFFSTAKLGFGGAYSLVYNSFFLATQIILAGGQQQQRFNLANEAIDRLIPASGANVKISFGYNGPRYFSSFNLFTDSTNIFIKNRILEFSTTEVSLFLGTHF